MARHTSSLRGLLALDRAFACMAAASTGTARRVAMNGGRDVGRVTGESALSNLGGAAPTSVGVLELQIPEVGTIKFRQLL
ncbi:MAG: hypothetical protein OXH52_01100 [Gammaproteobacteria bacterium]|nr:hypothetical protein [Gammaproteobacteria bacterium]